MTTATEKDDANLDPTLGSGLAGDPSAAEIWAQADEAEGEASTVRQSAAKSDQPGVEVAQDGQSSAAQPAAKPADEQHIDPYADLPPAVREEILGLKNTVGQLQSRVRNTEGNLGGLKNQLQRSLQSAAAAASKAGDATPSQEQISAAAKSPEALKRLIEDYPEFGGAIKEVVDAQAQEMAQLRERLERLGADSGGVTREELRDLQNSQVISEIHPGWKRRVSTNEFGEWLRSQPREVQLLANSEDPEDAIRLLDIEKQHRESAAAKTQQQTEQQRQRQKVVQRAASIPTGKPAASIKSKDVSEMTDDEFWRSLDAADAAR